MNYKLSYKSNQLHIKLQEKYTGYNFTREIHGNSISDFY